MPVHQRSLALEDVGRVRPRQLLVEQRRNQLLDLGTRSYPFTPTRSQDPSETIEESAHDRLHCLPLIGGQYWVGARQQVEDRQLLLAQALGNGALLLLGQVLGQLDEPAQVLVDVQAARVVAGDQLLDPVDQVVPGWVPGRGGDRPLLGPGGTTERKVALSPSVVEPRPSGYEPRVLWLARGGRRWEAFSRRP